MKFTKAELELLRAFGYLPSVELKGIAKKAHLCLQKASRTSFNLSFDRNGERHHNNGFTTFAKALAEAEEELFWTRGRIS